MKVRHLFDLDFVQFSPRSWCFAESDAVDVGGGGGGGGDAEEAPEIEIEENAPETPADDLEDYEFEGKKGRIPKEWKDWVEQGKDYRYKTGQLANEKRTVESDKARYAALVKQAEETIKANQPARPDDSMLDRMSEKYDPDRYHLERARWEKWAQSAYQAENERKRLDGEAMTKAEREREARRSTTDQELIKAIPKWKDSAAKAADRVRIENYAKNEGVDPGEFGELDVDHRLTKFVYKAMLFDEAVAKAKANKGDIAPSTTPATPVRRAQGGGGGVGGPPKTTEGYIAWRRKGGKM